MKANPLTPTCAPIRSPRCLLVTAALLAAAQVLTAGPYPEGEFIEIAGTVVDAEGMPIPDVRVIFEARRRSFSLARFQRTTRDHVEQSVETDPHGRFSFRWRWLDYYNRFAIRAGVPKRAAAGQSLEVLASADLSDRIRRGSPVVVTLTVENLAYVDSLRDFLASLDTADEKRVYEEMGNPDRVQKTADAEAEEITWWYFRSGKAYRFHQGHLQQVVHFEAITPFEE